jgi:serine O-acetyltransferase
MKYQSTLEDLRADLEVYQCFSKSNWFWLIMTKQSLWAILQYRISHWVELKVNLPVIRQFLKAICTLWKKIIEITTAIEFPSEVEIGKGLFLPHAHGIVLHPEVKLGDYCTISQDVTIGLGGRGEKQGVPKIGSRVYIAPGAKIFGKIEIGNDVAIGANAVVTKDLPDKAVAVGIPAKVISYQGSGDFLAYL